MDDDAADELRMTQSQYRGERTAGGHTDRDHAARVRAITMPHEANLRGDDRCLAVAARGRRVEPVPAAPGIGRFGLPRQKHEAAQPVG